MSDIRIRKQNRLVDRLRAGLVTPSYTEARERKCRGCSAPRGGGHQKGCKGTVPFDAMDQIRLMAFLGDAEAREIAECKDIGVGAPDSWLALRHWSLKTWLRWLNWLTTKLPPARVTVQCMCCNIFREVIDDSVNHCGICDDTYWNYHDTPAERWLMAVAAEAVGRTVLGPATEHEGCESVHDYGDCDPQSPRRHPSLDQGADA